MPKSKAGRVEILCSNTVDDVNRTGGTAVVAGTTTPGSASMAASSLDRMAIRPGVAQNSTTLSTFSSQPASPGWSLYWICRSLPVGFDSAWSSG